MEAKAHGPPLNTKVQQEKGDAAVKAYEEDGILNDAIVDLVLEMSRVEPVLLREGAYAVIRRTVHDLLRDAGKVN
jgi:hypothetical protein